MSIEFLQEHCAEAPDSLIERMITFIARWDGLDLPPLPGDFYEGGVLGFSMDARVEHRDGVGWLFDPCPGRTSVPYWYGVDEQDRFGLVCEDWVPTHPTVEAWFESYALIHATGQMRRVTAFHGQRVQEAVDATAAVVPDLAPIPEACGITDAWWQGGDGVLLGIFRGEAELFRRETLIAEQRQRATAKLRNGTKADRRAARKAVRHGKAKTDQPADQPNKDDDLGFAVVYVPQGSPSPWAAAHPRRKE
ncbi:hypothetical protein B0I32_1706 [Nonomuraea fuscirosea]|uniref:Uncharacterized protein n=2 Tax=Nonomuraea fuscirosea TaxID=1291556 RepID=A0A2T0LIE3_9ACTN|nr:hypothetical protein B0I32_1706 [Nonomuraea fuscirosea]